MAEGAQGTEQRRKRFFIQQNAERAESENLAERRRKAFSLSECDGSTADRAGSSTRGPSTAGGCPAGAGAGVAGVLAAFVNLRHIE